MQARRPVQAAVNMSPARMRSKVAKAARAARAAAAALAPHDAVAVGFAGGVGGSLAFAMLESSLGADSGPPRASSLPRRCAGSH